MRLRTAADTVLAVLAAPAGCGDPDRSTDGGARSDPDPASPTSVGVPSIDPDARIPVGPETAPADFPGDDDAFLDRVDEGLERLGEEAPADDSRMVTVGREICGLLGGGGAVADKLDFYAGQRSLADEGWTAVILAAIDEYCPDLGPGYLADRTEHPPMTPPEQADLARYVMRAGSGIDPGLSDTRTERLATRVCRRLEKDPDGFLGDLDPVADRGLLVTVVGLTSAYCTDLGRSSTR